MKTKEGKWTSIIAEGRAPFDPGSGRRQLGVVRCDPDDDDRHDAQAQARRDRRDEHDRSVSHDRQRSQEDAPPEQCGYEE
jgi:hypothetical protein